MRQAHPLNRQKALNPLFSPRGESFTAQDPNGDKQLPVAFPL